MFCGSSVTFVGHSVVAMAPHSSTLAWKIPRVEEPGGLQSIGSLRVGHNWETSLSLFTFHFHALEKEMATHSSVLAWRIPGTREPGGLLSMGSHRVGHDWIWLSSSSSSSNIHITMLFSYIIPPSPSPTESKCLFFTSMSLLLPCIKDSHCHFSKFHIYALIYIFAFLFLTYFTLYNRLQFHSPD